MIIVYNKTFIQILDGEKMPKFYKCDGYKDCLDIRTTDKAIKYVKDNFENIFARRLGLERITAPLFVTSQSGLNDNLNGTERPVSFDIPDAKEDTVQIVHSLAKWKRLALRRYGYGVGEGIYTDMNAVRRDEELDNLHSIYVDQWDWEKIIAKEDRNLDFLYNIADEIFASICETQDKLCDKFTSLRPMIKRRLEMISSNDLLKKYPDLSPKEREDAIAKECGSVLITQIGGILSNGERHDGRAPDYDDWNLNGDLLVWYEPLKRAIELSSMGIRVDPESMARQLALAGCDDRRELPFHKELLSGNLPQTVGGGIGQSRLCLIMLNKIHIGQVQASVWGEETLTECEKNGIMLL